MFNQFLKYNTKILLRSFKTKLGKEHTSKPTIGNESLLEHSNDNGLRIINLPYENLIIKRTLFAHHNVHKHTTTGMLQSD